MGRPLSPTTEKLYSGVLTRAFGNAGIPTSIPPGIASWTDSNKALLRAAVRRKYADARRADEAAELLEQLPGTWSARRVTEIPSEDEALRYEQACQHLPPGRRAMALLPLAIGLRAREEITLTRRSVERAAQYGELLVMRKGGKEQNLPAVGAKALFAELLGVMSAKRVSLFESVLAEGKAWKTTGQVLSTGNPEAAYHALHRLVHAMGEEAGIDELRPHKLRHAFATRMFRDGASLPTIQWMLGHADIKTTLRYVHPGSADAAKFVRTF